LRANFSAGNMSGSKHSGTNRTNARLSSKIRNNPATLFEEAGSYQPAASRKNLKKNIAHEKRRDAVKTPRPAGAE
jgi:hypothetical protein